MKALNNQHYKCPQASESPENSSKHAIGQGYYRQACPTVRLWLLEQRIVYAQTNVFGMAARTLQGFHDHVFINAVVEKFLKQLSEEDLDIARWSPVSLCFVHKAGLITMETMSSLNKVSTRWKEFLKEHAIENMVK